MFTGKDCKECKYEKTRQWRADNAEYILGYSMQYREGHREQDRAATRQWAKRNPEKKRENVRRWCADNPDRVAEHARRDYVKNVAGNPDRKARANAAALAWSRANPERAAENGRRWRAENRDTCRQTENRRRARMAGNIADLTDSQWQAILAFHSSPEGTRCAYCFGVCAKVTVDHIVPVSKGGGHTVSNVVPACQPCNSRKGNKEVAKSLS